MRLTQYITELSMTADTKIKYTNKPGQIFAEVMIDDESDSEYGKSLFYVKIMRDTAEGIITFGPTRSGIFDKEFPYDYWTINFEDENMNTDMTPKGKGVSLKLFAAIQKIVSDFLKKEKPEVIVFSGWGESKVTLYNRLAKMIAKGIGGQMDSTANSSHAIYYIWK